MGFKLNDRVRAVSNVGYEGLFRSGQLATVIDPEPIDFFPSYKITVRFDDDKSELTLPAAVFVRVPDKHPPVVSFEDRVRSLYVDSADLLLRKHKDYGPKNISQAPGGAINGLRVRMWDKFARINNLLDSGASPENESLRDSWVDLMNYAAIGVLVLDKEWPE